MSDFRLPSNSQRITIVGKTGSGKTLAAVWHLSLRDYDRFTWVIFDFKHDELLNSIGAKRIGIRDVIPSSPGLYIVQPQANEKEEVEAFLWQVWRRGNCGVYIDEGYMIDPKSPAFQAILTQGRSKNIPVIILSQRPVFLSRFAISEADFLQVFWLNDVRDRNTVKAFAPFDLNKRLENYWSHYYDVAADAYFHLRPVPDKASLIASFRARLKPARRSI